ncbi:MAG: preprotein translocase subunit YajC [Bacteroidota bacterium]
MIGYYILAQQTPDAGGGFMQTIILFGLIFVIFYFMIIRPQQKRQKDRQKMLDAVKKGDKIITGGGIHGTVVGMEEKTVLVQIADNVKVKLDRGSVTAVIREAEPDDKPKQ